MIEFVDRLGERRRVRRRRPGQRPHAGFGNMLTDEQIQAIVEYVRGL